MAKLDINLTMKYRQGGFNVTGRTGFRGDTADTATLLAIAVDRVLTTLDLSPEQFLAWMMIVNDFPKEGIRLDTMEAERQATREEAP